MDAEKELAELYEAQKPETKELSNGWMRVTSNGGLYIAAEHIDLIANLVVERLKASNEVGKE